jgi:uncharacterized peroxidase-related enzyme
LIYDYREAVLSPADRALCDFAVKLTLRPGEAGAPDLDALRGHGLDDGALGIAVQVVAYFNYINRIADGLGVDPEKWMRPGPEEWKRRKARDYR